MNYLEDSLDMPLRDILKIIQTRIMNQTSYCGVKTLKSPTDFWIYHELIWKLRPDIIIEIGNAWGGSALGLAHICDKIGKGFVIGVDIQHNKIPAFVKNHQRIDFVTGKALDCVDTVRAMIQKDDTVMVIEDSSHTYEHTLAVIRAYSQLVTQDNYMIVEDGINSVGLTAKTGPYEAINTFLEENDMFIADRSLESFLVTWNPKGYLKRVIPF